MATRAKALWCDDGERNGLAAYHLCHPFSSPLSRLDLFLIPLFPFLNYFQRLSGDMAVTSVDSNIVSVSDGSDPATPPPAAQVAVESDKKSPGVRRAEALSAVLAPRDYVFIFVSVFIVAFAYGLDGMLRYAYQPYAAASFSQHSLLATVNVLRSVVAAAAQPASARIADIFGRVELICLSVVLYVLGTIIEAVSQNVATFAAGALVYQIGYTIIILLLEVIIADITSTRARLLFSYIPTTPRRS